MGADLGDVCGRVRRGRSDRDGQMDARVVRFPRRDAGRRNALRLLNSVVLRQSPRRAICHGVLHRLTLKADNARPVIACGGHPAPILVPARCRPAAVAAEVTCSGSCQPSALPPRMPNRRPGDSLVAYTDGVTDQGREVRRSPGRPCRTSADDTAEELVASGRPGQHPVAAAPRRHRDPCPALPRPRHGRGPAPRGGAGQRPGRIKAGARGPAGRAGNSNSYAPARLRAIAACPGQAHRTRA